LYPSFLLFRIAIKYQNMKFLKNTASVKSGRAM
jgi:hypothetical protein